MTIVTIGTSSLSNTSFHFVIYPAASVLTPFFHFLIELFTYLGHCNMHTRHIFVMVSYLFHFSPLHIPFFNSQPSFLCSQIFPHIPVVSTMFTGSNHIHYTLFYNFILVIFESYLFLCLKNISGKNAIIRKLYDVFKYIDAIVVDMNGWHPEEHTHKSSYMLSNNNQYT